MLRHLFVENYALIDRLEMNLGAGLNIVTGETGAGKSILIGALGLLLGSRGEAGAQKDARRNCVVEGTFSIEGYGLERFFDDNDLDYAAETTLRRVISASGKSRAYINELPVGLAVLRELGDRLIDIHSQHENLLLKDDRFRTATLDGVAGQNDLVKRYDEAYGKWRRAIGLLDEARSEAAEACRDEEYVRHLAGELAAARLVAGEQEKLESEARELSHSDDIREAFGSAAGELETDETGILARLNALRQSIGRIAGVHSRAGEFSDRLGAVYVELQDLEREMAAETERTESDPARSARTAARLDAIYGLQQKHHACSVEDLLELQARFETRLEAIEHGGERISGLEADVAARGAEASMLAAEISKGRRAVAGVVGESVEGVLRRLGMPEARLVVEVAAARELRSGGGDEVRFLFTANSSMPPRPVEKVASGGEVSRVMLALKTISARSVGQPTVIFDEIDAGVSGRVADAMGDIIAEFARHSQVVNITHLPQIAAKGGEHFLVYKQDGSTHIRLLSPDERVTEIAKMLSGSVITDAAAKQARELLG